MPVSLDYCGICFDIFLWGGVVFLYLAISVYRLLAASALPCLARRRFCWPFYLMVFIVLPVAGLLLLPALKGESSGAVFFYFVMLAPCIFLGALGMSQRWRLRSVLISCVLEALLFPVWFYLVFLMALAIEGGD